MSVEVKTPTRTQFEHVEFQCGEKQSTFHHSGENDNKQERNVSNANGKPSKQVTILGHQQKPDGPKQESKQYQAKRRRFSVPSQRGPVSGFRKRRYSCKQDKIVLPTKFLLGGNISDPLNLNSLYDDATGMLLNEKTPNSSPLPFPTHRENTNSVFPPNITDPLNLNSGEDVDDLFASRLMARKRRRHKHKKKPEEADISTSSVTVTPSKETEKKKNLTLALKIDIDATAAPIPDHAESDSELLASSQKKCEDKIVSPVIPQSSKSRKRRRTVSECTKPEFLEGIGNARRALLRTESVPFDHDVISTASTPKKVKRQTSAPKTLQQLKPPVEKRRKSSCSTQHKFVYGNYNRYYGYRNPELEQDTRLNSLRPDWFDGKDVLDIGCNVGHITLAIARDFRPKKIVGMDIDGRLIAAARKNIRYYMTTSTVKTEKYPVSVKLNYGPLAVPTVGKSKSTTFPNNIMFLQGNYVLDFDELLDAQKEEYDVIMALSITKWIHLNFGDAGMKRFFKRMFKQLRPGGRLILEPQAWPSYKKKKKLTEDIFKNFQSIRFKPDQFTDYLLSREVGFSTCEAIDVPFNKSAGFRRPIQLFTKPDTHANSPNPLPAEGVEDPGLPGGTDLSNCEALSKPTAEDASSKPDPSSCGVVSPPAGVASKTHPSSSEALTAVEDASSKPDPSSCGVVSPPAGVASKTHPSSCEALATAEDASSKPDPSSCGVMSPPTGVASKPHPSSCEALIAAEDASSKPDPSSCGVLSSLAGVASKPHSSSCEALTAAEDASSKPDPSSCAMLSTPAGMALETVSSSNEALTKPAEASSKPDPSSS